MEYEFTRQAFISYNKNIPRILDTKYERSVCILISKRKLKSIKKKQTNFLLPGVGFTAAVSRALDNTKLTGKNSRLTDPKSFKE